MNGLGKARRARGEMMCSFEVWDGAYCGRGGDGADSRVALRPARRCGASLPTPKATRGARSMRGVGDGRYERVFKARGMVGMEG